MGKAEYKVLAERSQFFMIPNSVDDMGLSVYAFRLYCRIKRVAGENGACWQSTETLSEACKMSAGSVSKAKHELIEAGLIRVETKKHDSNQYDYHEITIVDIWSTLHHMNGNRSPGEGNRSPHERDRSPGEGNRSPHERDRSPGETKNTPLRIPLEEELEEEEEVNPAFIFDLYNKTIGPVPPIMNDTLRQAAQQYPHDWTNKAFEIAAGQNKRNWSYIEAILKRWKTQGNTNDNKPNRQNQTKPTKKTANYRDGKFADFIDN